MHVKTFPKGIHPYDHKKATKGKPIEEISLPEMVIIPLHQHTGVPCEPLVEKGEKVLLGQKIGDNSAKVSAPIHSSVSGEVLAIEPRLHPSGLKVLSIVIASDGEQKEIERGKPPANPSPEEVRHLVREAGIVGLGGAAFPTQVKLTPPDGQIIDSVIINGCECEPYITVDHRNMLEKTDLLLEGLRIILKTVGAREGFIGVETNKGDAIEKLLRATASEKNITVVPLESKYPQGAEKQLIKAILDREVPSGGLPFEVGVIVQNVGTTIAIAQAVSENRPLTHKAVTVSGRGVKEPRNLAVPIGTLVRHLVNECGGFNSTPAKVILGGPMMGTALSSLDVPILKASSGVVVLDEEEVKYFSPKACIKCGNCVKACPLNLLPSRLSLFAQHQLWDSLLDYGILDCMECASCTYVCPSKIPLVQWIKLGKFMVNKIQRAESRQQRAEKA